MLYTVSFTGPNGGRTWVQADADTPSQAAYAVRDLWLGTAYRFAKAVQSDIGTIYTFRKGMREASKVIVGHTTN